MRPHRGVRRPSCAVGIALCTMLAVPGAAAAASDPAGRAAPGPQRPSATEQQVAIDRNTHALEKLDRAIAETRSMLQKSLDAPYLPELYFQMAELYVDRSRFEHARALAVAEQAGLGLSGEASLVVQLTKQLAIETYEKILVEFPDYPDRDQVLFFQGHEHRELGAYDSLTKTYDGLIAAFPKSHWAQEARLILADIQFDKMQYPEAEAYYRGILAGAESRVHPAARYKLGWIRVYQENWREALDFFKEAATTADLLPAAHLKVGTASRALDLRREAILAMAWPFSEVRRPYQAAEFFAPLADTRALYLEALRKLAARYTTRERPLAAATVLREVVRLSTDGELNLDAVEKIVDTVEDVPTDDPQRLATVAADVSGLARTYTALIRRPETTVQRISAPSIDMPKVQAALEVQARDLVTKAQGVSQKTQDRSLAGQVSDAYAHYLTAFSDAPQRSVMQANAAAASLTAEHFLPAAEAYEAVARTHGGDGASAEAGGPRTDVYHAVAAYYDALESDRLKRQSSPARVGNLDRLQLLRAREGLKQLGTYYVHHYPNDAHVPTVRFNVARMFYQQGELREAAKLFVGFVDAYPSHKDVATAGHLALDALSQLDDLGTMQKLAQHFADNGRIQDATFKAEAHRLATAAGKRQVEMTVVTAPQGAFGETMLAAWEAHKGSPEGEQYLYAGFSKARSEGRLDEAQSFGDKLMGAYPRNRWAAEVMLSLGNMAAQATDFERAAAIYEQFAKSLPQDPQAGARLAAAAQMRDLLGQTDAAVRDYVALLRQGTASGRDMATRRLMALAAKSGAWQTLTNQAAGAGVANTFYSGLAAVHTGDLERAHRMFTAAGRGTATGSDAAFVARARFELARMTHAAFSSLDYAGARSAEKVIKQKLALSTQAEAQYVAALQAGNGDIGIAASYELSRLYRALGRFIARAPLPPGVAEHDYRAALAQQAQPYERRAEATLAACTKKAAQLKIFSPFAAACVRGDTGEVEGDVPTPPAAPVAPSGAYAAEVQALRRSLLKNPNDVAVLTQLAQKGIAAGDNYGARAALYRLDEVDGRAAKGLLGLVLWRLGDLPAAAAALQAAQHQGDHRAALNLYGLYVSFGYADLARSVLPSATALRGIDLQAPDVHPAARRALQSRGTP